MDSQRGQRLLEMELEVRWKIGMLLPEAVGLTVPSRRWGKMSGKG